ncbi:hypothetical protein F5Y15DRAFT_150129 [Xylariaceae sp. FL0016]|nr:hypothetical protein F5Y15DRAFT_150129 [Xylariaceae sp. FL0016]
MAAPAFSTVLVGLLLAVTVQASSISLSLSATVPGNASAPVDPAFAGFGIEPSNLFSFTGGATPNVMTNNLLNTLKSYTGTAPHIRLGGNTGDYLWYDPAFMEWTWVWNENRHGQGTGNLTSDAMKIGPRFFEAANRFPTGTPVTWGLNMAYNNASDYASRLATMADNALTKCTNIDIRSFEIGNEPDLYLQNGLRTSWTAAQYMQEWTDRAYIIYSQVLTKHNLNAQMFEAASTASTIGNDFQISSLASLGIGSKAPGMSSPYLSSWSQHDYYYFFGISPGELSLQRLMQLSTTEDQFVAWAEQVRQATATSFPYALREMGIVGPIGSKGITDVFGTALWTLNFLFYAASLNITAVHLHMTDNSYASPWQPIYINEAQPHVRPLYAGIAAFDQVIGSGCDSRIVPVKPELDLQGTTADYTNSVRAYAVYQEDNLRSVVVVNSVVANAAQATKHTLTVNVKLPASMAGQTLHLSYLTAPGADSTNGTTWRGISYEGADGLPVTVLSAEQTVDVAGDGTAVISVRDSEALVATVGRRLTATEKAECRASLGAGENTDPSASSPSLPPPPEGSHKINGGEQTQASPAVAAFRASFVLAMGVLVL